MLLELGLSSASEQQIPKRKGRKKGKGDSVDATFAKLAKFRDAAGVRQVTGAQRGMR